MERIPPVTFAKSTLTFLCALNLSHLFCVCVLYHPQLNLLEFEKKNFLTLKILPLNNISHNADLHMDLHMLELYYILRVFI